MRFRRKFVILTAAAATLLSLVALLVSRHLSEKRYLADAFQQFRADGLEAARNELDARGKARFAPIISAAHAAMEKGLDQEMVFSEDTKISVLPNDDGTWTVYFRHEINVLPDDPHVSLTKVTVDKNLNARFDWLIY